MKATGTTQKMNKSGRLVVPKDIQKQLGYTEGMKFELFISEDDYSLVFSPVYPSDALSTSVALMKQTLEAQRDVDDENYDHIFDHSQAISQLLEDIKTKERAHDD